ncbi:MAG: OBAP family protein [Nostoc sp.]
MKLPRIPSIILVVVIILLVHLPAAWADGNTAPNVTPPGGEKSTQTKILETGAKVLQSKTPLNALNVYVDGFHFHNGDMNRQVEAHHYCNLANEDLIQCVIYNGNGENARLMGIEYIVSEKIFQTLPQDEKKLWHSHAYEVKSGQLIAPSIPEIAEHALIEKLASTYGKTWHTWQAEQPNMTLPLGLPELMMGFTADGQINPALVSDRDQRFNISKSKKHNRADISIPRVQPGADAWQTGQTVQLQLVPLSGVDNQASSS